MEADKLPTDEPGKVYVAFSKVNGEGSLAVSTFSNVLKFTSKEIDPSTGDPEDTGYDDEYEISEFELTGSDYIIPTFASNFAHLWEQIGASGEEAEETLQLSGMKSIAGMLKFLLLHIAQYTDRIRCHRTTSESSFIATRRRHRRPHQPEHTHTQAPRQDCHRRPRSSHRPDGILIQDGRHNKDHGKERGRKCGGTGDRSRGMKIDKRALMV